MSYHDLRRTTISNWSRAANPQTLMALAGHANIATTMAYYASATDDQIERARQAAEAAISGAMAAADAIRERAASGRIEDE